MWRVEVWFYTGQDYTPVRSKAFHLRYVNALALAADYLSDSKGVRIVSCDGSIEYVKGGPA